MSQVRMCDKCGEIFSERREGWQTFSVSRASVNPYGQPIQITEEYDACPACAFNGTVQPVLKAIEDRPPMESGTA